VAEKCYHNSEKLLEKQFINAEIVYATFYAVVTKTSYQMFYECMDCKKKCTEM